MVAAAVGRGELEKAGGRAPDVATPRRRGKGARSPSRGHCVRTLSMEQRGNGPALAVPSDLCRQPTFVMMLFIVSTRLQSSRVCSLKV